MWRRDDLPKGPVTAEIGQCYKPVYMLSAVRLKAVFNFSVTPSPAVAWSAFILLSIAQSVRDITTSTSTWWGRDSSVGIVLRYGLDGSGIDSR